MEAYALHPAGQQSEMLVQLMVSIPDVMASPPSGSLTAVCAGAYPGQCVLWLGILCLLCVHTYVDDHPGVQH